MLKARLSQAGKLNAAKLNDAYEVIKEAFENQATKEALEHAAKEKPAAIIIQRQLQVSIRRKRMREAVAARNKATVTI